MVLCDFSDHFSVISTMDIKIFEWKWSSIHYPEILNGYKYSGIDIDNIIYEDNFIKYNITMFNDIMTDK